MLSWLFTPAKTAEEILKEWQVGLRKQQNDFQREIDDSNRNEPAIIADIREAAKVDAIATKHLAAALVVHRKHRERLYENKSRLYNLNLQLVQHAQQAKLTKMIGSSAKVMHDMNKLIKFPDMRQMAMEMAKAGFIQDMINETMNEDDEEVLTETNEEIERVLGEITAGIELPRVKVGVAAVAGAAPLRGAAGAQREEKING